MPKYLVRRERCIPYEIVVEAADEDAAERVAYGLEMSDWNEQSGYWQDLQTEETDEEADFADDDIVDADIVDADIVDDDYVSDDEADEDEEADEEDTAEAT